MELRPRSPARPSSSPVAIDLAAGDSPRDGAETEPLNAASHDQQHHSRRPRWDVCGMSSLRASPLLPPLFVTTVVMQVLATAVSLAFNNYLRSAYVVWCSVVCAGD